MADTVVLTIVLGIAAVVGLLLAFLGLLYVSRGNPLERIRTLGDATLPGASEDGFLRQIQTHVSTHVADGNEIEVLFDDAVYPRLFADLERAQTLITWHVFWLRPGVMADRLRDILIERARAGVKVLFLHDRFGASVSDEWRATLADAGVEVRRFRPLSWNTLYKWQQRSHTRTVVIDGRIGWTGGFAIADEWSQAGEDDRPWRDTSARFLGPAVHQLQAAFAADWVESTGELIVGDVAFPPVDGHAGSKRAGVLYGAPSVGSTGVERYFALSIAAARESLYLTNAYFVPDDDFRHLLCAAAGRGVDVRVLTPDGNTDQPSTWYAGRCHYEQLLEGGVRIFEFDPTMVHAKTLVADGTWCSIGTMNFDNRSMSLNDEVTLLVQDEAVGRRLREQFMRDLEISTEIDLETFRQRGGFERAKERFFVFFSRFL